MSPPLSSILSVVSLCVRHACAGIFSLRCTCRTGRILVSCVFCRRDCMFIGCFESRIRKLECAQAARALPFPFGRKRKQKGPFCTAHRQRENGATNQSLRRDAQKLAASRRSDNLCARFFTARDAIKKSPHEPRSEQSAMLPWPSVSGYADEGRA